MIEWGRLLALVSGTFVSEDLTCLAAGALIRQGAIDPITGFTGCFLGIWLGDCGLWILGRRGGEALAGPRSRIGRLLGVDEVRLTEARRAFERHLIWTPIAARFVPGARLPFHVAAGVLGAGPRFLAWNAVASFLWTLLVLTATARMAALLSRLRSFPSWGPAVLGAAIVLGLILLSRRIATPGNRIRLAASIRRLLSREFLPSWVLYAPVLPWIGWLALRHGGLSTVTAANPGMAQGGFVGESKFDILRRLPAAWTIPSALIVEGTVERRLLRLDEAMRDGGFGFPVVLKPDAGQRGQGMKIVEDRIAAREYLAAHPPAVLLQPWHDGPFEAGIFYYRIPGEPTGRIFSVTDKIFPAIVGDGRHSIEDLIWSHPRYRMQAGTFLARHAGRKDRVLAGGERLVLARAGNHSQGTMFRDGSHLISAALESRIDAIARSFPGFFIGRFDVRYRDPGAFTRGEDLALVELNGITSESTNIYDPSLSLVAAYRILFRQWSLLYRIGAANVRAGRSPASVGEVIRAVVLHYRTRCASPVSD